ncbi:inositol 1,4,5-trisphosphate receptor-interacting protein-like 1 [Patagioenas fasciata]|uniref:inositol 1,4,5-trisphosphate receptor-interacting protein-like 1 n=1 Tax=Patagioenas fasciata TaxID=372321 RepID=UPI0032E92AA9
MALLDIVFGLWRILTLNVQSVGYELDEETRERMEQRAEMLNREMTRLWQEVEEMNQEQSVFAWASLLLSALQHWQCWAVAGVLVLLFGLCWWLRKWSRESQREEQSSGNNVEKQKHGDENNDANDPGRHSEDPRQRRVRKRDRDRQAVKNLVQKFIDLFNRDVSNTWYPVLEKAIEVGTAFEGWSVYDEDNPYCLLVPLKPPHGHIFHLEPCPSWPIRNFRIRVELVCTCEMEQPAGETRCLLHHPEEEQSRKEGPNILDDLCTDSYLDVQKTAEWFKEMVRRCWKDLPESATHRLMQVYSERSCKFQVLTQDWQKRFFIELMFGVQEGDSDLFLSNQCVEAPYTPRTLWPESYAVAEMKFFRHIASRAQRDTCHLRCLKLCAHYLQGRDFYIYIVKTVVMHQLTTILPLLRWEKSNFLVRMEHIVQHVESGLLERCINHFFIGNENVPEEINLPLDVRTAEPFNLCQLLDYESARLDFECVLSELWGLLLYES